MSKQSIVFYHITTTPPTTLLSLWINIVIASIHTIQINETIKLIVGSIEMESEDRAEIKIKENDTMKVKAVLARSFKLVSPTHSDINHGNDGSQTECLM